MSLTPEAYEEKKWRGLHQLQSALSGVSLDDSHYGWSSANYNKFESLSDLLEIAVITIENIDIISVDTFERTAIAYREMKALSSMLDDAAQHLTELGMKISKAADCLPPSQSISR